MRQIALACALVALCACSEEESAQSAAPPGTIVPVITEAPAGTYTLEKSHASLLFRVDHLGFSMYTARFKRFDATLAFDPANPEAMSVTAAVDPASIETDFPYPETVDFNAVLRGKDWLNVAKFPAIAFRSTAVALTAPNRARVTGDLTLLGVTRPLALDVTFNGGYRGHPMDPNARIGFSARGTLKRSAYGMTAGIPPEGSAMGVGDAVEVIIEAEFSGPPIATQ